MKPITTFDDFHRLDIRVGRILAVEEAVTKKPTYRLRIDFGPGIGERVSCGAFRNYDKGDLIGRQVIGIVNFQPKKMGPEVSEVLVLGVPGPSGATIYLTAQQDVEVGVAVF